MCLFPTMHVVAVGTPVAFAPADNPARVTFFYRHPERPRLLIDDLTAAFRLLRQRPAVDVISGGLHGMAGHIRALRDMDPDRRPLVHSWPSAKLLHPEPEPTLLKTGDVSLVTTPEAILDQRYLSVSGFYDELIVRGPSDLYSLYLDLPDDPFDF